VAASQWGSGRDFDARACHGLVQYSRFSAQNGSAGWFCGHAAAKTVTNSRPTILCPLSVVPAGATCQARAGDDPLGQYVAPLAYANMQVVAQTIEATGAFDDSRLSACGDVGPAPTPVRTCRVGVALFYRSCRRLPGKAHARTFILSATTLYRDPKSD